jgi:hypothetical protein
MCQQATAKSIAGTVPGMRGRPFVKIAESNSISGQGQRDNIAPANAGMSTARGKIWPAVHVPFVARNLSRYVLSKLFVARSAIDNAKESRVLGYALSATKNLIPTSIGTRLHAARSVLAYCGEKGQCNRRASAAGKRLNAQEIVTGVFALMNAGRCKLAIGENSKAVT